MNTLLILTSITLYLFTEYQHSWTPVLCVRPNSKPMNIDETGADRGREGL